MPKTKLSSRFDITHEMREWATRKCPTLDIDYYHDEFCDHWHGNGKMMVSWSATWRNWMRRTNNGSAPGLFGPDDKSIMRVNFSIVKKTVVTPQDKAWEEIDRLRDQAVAKGITMLEARQMSPVYLKKAGS